ncbi:MAG: CHASE2 domain-containing protein [Nitrospirae bacterium]|nr:MAG: CHASE2 domain-containing protein [Nitrospirota bacterium]
MEAKTVKIPKTSLVLVALCLAGLFFIEFLGFFEGINNYFYDFFFRLRGQESADSRIIIAGIDEKTLNKLGSWPIPRNHYATLLERVSGAKVVSFDIVMSEPSPHDKRLAAAANKMKNVIFPVYIDSELTMHYPVPPLPSSLVGHVHVEPDSDGIVRTIYHTLYFEGKAIPSFSSLAYELCTGNSPQRIHPAAGIDEGKGIKQADLMRINYIGGSGTFEHISFSDIVEGLYPPSYFADKIVLVGITGAGIGDKALTPFSQSRRAASGIEVHANSLQTLLSNNPIVEVPVHIRRLILILFSILLFMFFLNLSERGIVLAMTSVMLLTTLADYLLFAYARLWLPAAIFYAAAILLMLLAYLSKFDEALRLLDRTYAAMLPRLRWKDPFISEQKVSGLLGLLNTEGVRAKIQLLNSFANQLSFEKDLSDRALLSDVHGVFLFGPDGNKLLANEHIMRIFSENSLASDSLQTVIAGLTPFMSDNANFAEAVMDKRFGKEGAERVTVSFLGPPTGHFNLDASPLLLNNENYILFLFSDVTIIVEARKVIEEKNKELKELNQLKNKFLGIAAHDLRNPLSSIKGFSDMLLSGMPGPLTDRQKHISTTISNASKGMLTLLNDLLDISAIESGKIDLKLKSGSVKKLLEDRLTINRMVAEKKDIRLHETLEDLPDTIFDYDRMVQVVDNLISNAVKFSPPGSNVYISLKREDGMAMVSVKDEGPGLSEEDKGKLFGEFQKLSARPTGGEKSTGLGLSIVKKIIEAHKGTIYVESAPGSGAAFIFKIPLSEFQLP